jgi:hypothetical protein
MIRTAPTETRNHRDGPDRPIVSFLIFAVVALPILFGFATQLMGLSFDARDLVDTDGYMRYLRIQELLDGGEWFDPLFTRSNYPFGETSHWTRLLDVYVAGLATLLTPFLGGDALYWAAVWNGPLIFLGVGAAAYWALRPFLPPQMRNIVMPALLALPVVFLYTGPGRVDHHGAILVFVVAVLGWTMRTLEGPVSRNAIWLGVWIGLGMWLSVEFLVAMALCAVTLGLTSVVRDDRGIARIGSRAFAVAALVMAVATVVERGGAWRVVEVDRISVAYVALAAAISLGFASYAAVAPRLTGRLARLGVMACCGGVAVVAVLLLFPVLRGGPFGTVDPTVREIWLYQVAELKPVTDYQSATWPIMVLTPIVLGLIAGVILSVRRDRHAMLLTGWLVTYGILTVGQIRWGLFAHLLALPLLLAAVAPVYDWLGRRSTATVLRPLFLVALIVAVPVTVTLIGSSGDDQLDCPVGGGAAAVAGLGGTTVLASQDLGPETMYRSDHNVIATPYHRNEQGILFVREVMSMPPEEARPVLATRDVGIILLCPGRNDLTRPPDPSGTLYEALVDGPAPSWVTPVDNPVDNDFILYEVAG